MGWKGALRSVGAAVREAERQAKRKQRELERQQRHYEKMAELEQAAYEVETFENYIERLQSLHKEARPTIRWNDMRSAPEPQKPAWSEHSANHAREQRNHYTPSLLDKLLRRVAKKQHLLFQEIEEAKTKDEVTYQEALRQYEQEHVDWEDGRKFAQRVLAGDVQAQIEAINEFNPFTELGELGSRVLFQIEDGQPPIAVLEVHGEDVMPKESRSLLKSGKISVKQMTKGRFYELYQDYVCSSVLRVANEFFTIIPVESVIVTAVDNLLNTRTGHLEEQAILSVAIPRKTFGSLNLSTIDPSDAMQNFIHRMDFKKTKGFLEVHGEDVMPKESRSLLKSGKISVKQMTKGRFYELYQDYVCSSVLRVANEFFTIIPVESVIVTAVDNLLNTRTGHLEEQAILSVAIPRKTFGSLNLSTIDPSDAMQNFIHRMDFKKTKGFSPIERLSPGETPL